MDLVERLAAPVTDLARARDRVAVGVDGPDASGKTTLADRLADLLTDRLAVEMPGTTVLRASIDGFHQPRELRHRRGELSAEGYYRDSFDYPTLLGECLDPFLGGAGHVRTAAYDHRTEDARPTHDRHRGGERQHHPGQRDPHRRGGVRRVPARAVLLFDGVFLLREPLRERWTLSVYLRVSPAETLRRATTRDLDLFGSIEEIERRYRGRYLPGQALYRRDTDPEAVAHVVVDNERVDAPVIERWAVPG